MRIFPLNLRESLTLLVGVPRRDVRMERLRVWGLGFRVWGLGLSVKGASSGCTCGAPARLGFSVEGFTTVFSKQSADGISVSKRGTKQDIKLLSPFGAIAELYQL